MDLRAEARISFPPKVAFAAYRDEISELLPYLPNVRAVDLKSRKEEGSRIEIVNEWQGGGEIPAAVRAVLSEAALAWTDYASWDAQALRCDWRIETRMFSEAVKCTGCNSFLEVDVGSTLLEIRGSLDIDAKKIRGVPTFLSGRVGRAAEEFLVSRIQSNLREIAKGLERYLEERAKRG
ncbi:MAG: hypothetical protein ABSC94_08275 [Polyangiaceae bacterium]|jgi:hypothetical protein